MLGRILIVGMVGTGLVTAGESEPRAGVWETTFEKSGRPEHLRLILRIFTGGLGTASSRVTIQGSLHFSFIFDGRDHWELVRSCGYIVEPKMQLTDNYLGFQCSGPHPPMAASDRSPDVFGFDGGFNESRSQLSGTLRLGDSEIPVRFGRPEDSTSTLLAGHWIASGLGQTCVLHVYDDAATIDVYSSQQSVFGILVGVAQLPNERFNVSWADIGPYSFIGSVDPDRRTFQGTWHGAGLSVLRERAAGRIHALQPQMTHRGISGMVGWVPSAVACSRRKWSNSRYVA
jgi:hypothetical protein